MLKKTAAMTERNVEILFMIFFSVFIYFWKILINIGRDIEIL
jgi:hypothetical protein